MERSNDISLMKELHVANFLMILKFCNSDACWWFCWTVTSSTLINDFKVLCLTVHFKFISIMDMRHNCLCPARLVTLSYAFFLYGSVTQRSSIKKILVLFFVTNESPRINLRHGWLATARRRIFSDCSRSTWDYAALFESPIHYTYSEDKCNCIIYACGRVYNNVNGRNINHIKYALRECFFLLKTEDTWIKSRIQLGTLVFL